MKKTVNKINRINLYLISIDIDFRESPCTCDDWPCRCRTIERAWISYADIKEIVNILFYAINTHKPISSIDKYCFDRICRCLKIYDKDNYEIATCRGYYGEEIVGVYFAREDELREEYGKILELESDIEKIKYVLKMEYSYLVEDVDKASSANIVLCSSESIRLPRVDYSKRLEKNVIASYADYSLPVAVRKRVGDCYSVIDGYHRVSAIGNKDEIEIIVVE